MSDIWPSSDLFELMESIAIIEIRGNGFRLSSEFKDFVKGLDFQKISQVAREMVADGVFTEPETKDTRQVIFFLVVVMLWDSSLPEEETETAALFLSAFAWALNLGVLPFLKEGGQ